MKQGADWLAWSLQFIAGLLAGIVTGIAIISRDSPGRDIWHSAEHVFIFLTGTALVGAGLASFYGDQFWLGSSYRVIPPDDLDHSQTSRIISIIAGATGALLILTPILQHFEII